MLGRNSCSMTSEFLLKSFSSGNMNDNPSLDGFEPSAFGLTAERANRLCDIDEDVAKTFCKVYNKYHLVEQLKLLHVIVQKRHGLLETFLLQILNCCVKWMPKLYCQKYIEKKFFPIISSSMLLIYCNRIGLLV